MTLDLSMERFPYLFRGRTLAISSIDAFLSFKNSDYNKVYGTSAFLKLAPTPNGGSDPDYGLTGDPRFGGTPHSSLPFPSDQPRPTKLVVDLVIDAGGKTLPVDLVESVPATGRTRLRANAIDDLLFVVHYSVSNSQ
jgi:hypothetical protein